MPPIPIKNARIVVLALAGGTVLISAMLLALRLAGEGPPDEGARPLTFVVVALGLSNGVLYFVLRRIFLARAQAQREAHRAALRAGGVPRELFQLTLVGCALAEAVGLLGAITFFLGGHGALLLAPTLALGAILAQFPRAERYEDLLRS